MQYLVILLLISVPLYLIFRKKNDGSNNVQSKTEDEFPSRSFQRWPEFGPNLDETPHVPVVAGKNTSIAA